MQQHIHRAALPRRRRAPQLPRQRGLATTALSLLVCFCFFLLLSAAVAPAGAEERVLEADGGADEFAGLGDMPRGRHMDAAAAAADALGAVPPEGEEEDEFADAGSAGVRTPLQQQQQQQPQQGQGQTAQGRRDVKKGPQDFVLEIGAGVMLMLYAVCYVMGNSQNSTLADVWMARAEDMLLSEFAFVGPATETEKAVKAVQDGSSLFLRESGHEYTCYATGRRYCQSMLISANLKRRQDLVSTIYDVISPSPDVVTLTVVMNKEDMEPFVLALGPRKQIKQKLSDVLSLKTLARAVTIKDAALTAALEENRYLLVGEGAEVVSSVLGTAARETFTKHIDLVDFVLMTDQNEEEIAGTREVPRNVLQFKFQIPSWLKADAEDERSAEYDELLEAVFRLIDHIGRMRFRDQTRKSAHGRRKELEKERFKKTEEQRKEALEQKRTEKRQREQLEYEQLSAAGKQRRDAKEEKKKKKQQHKNKFRVKMVKG